MKSNSIKNNYLSETFSDIASGITAISVFVVLFIFPLWTHNMYFDILSYRYLFFKILVCIEFFLLVVLGIIYLLVIHLVLNL